MSKFYYGFWQNFYLFPWPLRFLMELLFICLAGYCIYLVLSKLCRIFSFKSIIVKGIVLAGTETVYIIGHKRDWAVKADRKVVDWGNDILDSEKKLVSKIKYRPRLEKLIIFSMIFIYFSAVLVDLPFIKSVNTIYISDLAKIKKIYLKWETMLSKGYENYPPLFIVDREEESVETGRKVSKKSIYLQLNSKGKDGSNIRKEPSLDSEILRDVEGKDAILYKDENFYDGERYWLKIYVPETRTTGWLSGKLVKKTQLEEILSEVK